MNEITFKVASKGEGKTKWLLDKAYEFSSTNPIVIVTEHENEFARFCEKYFAVYNKICPVYRYRREELPNNAVILIDDLFTHSLTFENITDMQINSYKMFVTINGQNN